MSSTQTWFSTPVSHCRFTASIGYALVWSMIFVVFHFFGQIPIKPRRRMVAATVLWEMISPSARRSAKILGDP